MAIDSLTGGFRGRGRAGEQFPDPFCDISSLAMPETIQDALRWCEFILLKQPSYREAISRVISYFITDVEITSLGNERLGREEKQKYIDFLNDVVGIRAVLHAVALDYLCYGNSFTSLIVPFRRYLACGGKSCGLELPMRKVCENNQTFHFRWANYEFHATCPKCGYSGPWRHVDRRSGEADDIKVKRWNPHEMDILWDPNTEDTAFVWKIPDYYRQQVRSGYTFQLERASWEVVQAVRHNQALLFDPDVIYHMKEEPLAGVHSRGWGISRVLTNFGQAWYVQVLKRYNEAIALDYVVPFRVITPMPRQGTGGDATQDPVLSLNMGNFTQRVQGMIQAHRQDPARWNILPFPIEYKALGGDATQLAPKDLLEQGNAELLNAVGIPVQMYQGDMTMQAAPAALRLFEANWSGLVHSLNRFLATLVDKVAQIQSWEPVRARLQRVTHADDLNRQMAKLQLMMGGQISRTTGLATVGLEFGEEERRKLEEERISAEATQEMQEEMEQSALMDEMAMPAPQGGQGAGMPAQPGAMPAAGGQPAAGGEGGGDPAAAQGQMMPGAAPGGASAAFGAMQLPGPNVPMTLDEIQSLASQWADWLITMPESQKDSALIKLKKENEAVWLMAKSMYEDKKEAAALQGRDMILQQQYGKTASARNLHQRCIDLAR